MKGLFNKAFFGRSSRVSGMVGIGALSFVLGCNSLSGNDNSGIANPNAANSASNSSAAVAQVPSNQAVEALVKETLDKFSDAVESGDFNELHQYSSENFQRTYTVEQVAEGFKSYTDQKKIVVPILKKVDPMNIEFDRPTSVRKKQGLDVLSASGKFDTKPHAVRADFEYVSLGGEWKLLQLVINIP